MKCKTVNGAKNCTLFLNNSTKIGNCSNKVKKFEFYATLIRLRQLVLDYSGEHNIPITTNPYGF